MKTNRNPIENHRKPWKPIRKPWKTYGKPGYSAQSQKRADQWWANLQAPWRCFGARQILRRGWLMWHLSLVCGSKTRFPLVFAKNSWQFLVFGTCSLFLSNKKHSLTVQQEGSNQMIGLELRLFFQNSLSMPVTRLFSKEALKGVDFSCIKNHQVRTVRRVLVVLSLRSWPKRRTRVPVVVVERALRGSLKGFGDLQGGSFEKHGERSLLVHQKEIRLG